MRGIVSFRPSRLLDITAAASFGAYILHPPIVVALQVMIQGFAIPALFKFLIVSLLGIVLAFAAAHWASNVPGVRAMLGSVRPQRDERTRVRAS
jgi:glucans biosynthesis protein C